MVYILYFILAYLALTTLILLFNRREFTPLLETADHRFSSDAPLVSICIPARNEELTIERCIRSALNQTYPNTEVLVLDDQSTDSTSEVIDKLKKIHGDSLHFISGKPKPHNWIGKPWACQQLADASTGAILLFIDADAWLEPDAAARTVQSMDHDTVDMLTVWPMQKLQTFWEKTVIPLVYYALLSLLPARYVYSEPKCIPPFLQKYTSPYFSAACGQFLAFRRQAYQSLGGHRSVRDKLVEDLALARRVKEKGLRMKMYHGKGTVFCRMYRTQQQMYQGFRRNFLPGFRNNVPFFILVGLIHFIIFLLPYITFMTGLYLNRTDWIALSGTAIVIPLLHRLPLARWFDWNISYALLHPLGIIWFQQLGIQVLKDYVQSNTISWKERNI